MKQITDKPLHEYSSVVEYNNRTIEIVLRSYEKPIAHNDHYAHHTRITFSNQGAEIATFDLPSIVEPEASEGIMNEIKANLSKFKI